MPFTLFLLLLSISITQTVVGDQYIDGTIHSGQATYYTEWRTGYGSCGFPPASVNPALCALSQSYMTGPSSTLCGSQYCVQLWAASLGNSAPPPGSPNMVVVKVTDTCMGCAKDDVDLSDAVFDTIAPKSAGRVSVYWRFVDCSQYVWGPINQGETVPSGAPQGSGPDSVAGGGSSGSGSNGGSSSSSSSSSSHSASSTAPSTSSSSSTTSKSPNGGGSSSSSLPPTSSSSSQFQSSSSTHPTLPSSYSPHSRSTTRTRSSSATTVQSSSSTSFSIPSSYASYIPSGYSSYLNSLLLLTGMFVHSSSSLPSSTASSLPSSSSAPGTTSSSSLYTQPSSAPSYSDTSTESSVVSQRSSMAFSKPSHNRYATITSHEVFSMTIPSSPVAHLSSPVFPIQSPYPSNVHLLPSHNYVSAKYLGHLYQVPDSHAVNGYRLRYTIDEETEYD